jgi:transcriptional regulator with XRE-family HTH domain
VTSSLAQRIDRLFRTNLSPKGREYSYREVATAIVKSEESRRRGEAISAAYIWGLRAGVKDNPTFKHLQALARFFEVSPSYFFDEELTELPEHARLLAATSRDCVRQLAVGALDLSDESVNVLLNIASHLRALEGLPGVAQAAIIEVASAGISSLGAAAAPSAETMSLS